MPALPPRAATRRGEGRSAEGRSAEGRSRRSADAGQGGSRQGRAGDGRSASAAASASANGHAAGDRVFASPLARRIAKDAGIDVAAVTGSGPHGRVVKADVEAAIAGGGAKAAPRGQAGAPAPRQRLRPRRKAMSDDAVLKLFEEGSYELVPHDNMRKTIARRLVEAKTDDPAFLPDARLRARRAAGAARAAQRRGADEEDRQGRVPAYKLSVNDMVIKAMALALRDVPDANASWTESAMVKHKHADVGVAVSIPGGLITPIIRHADEKTLSAISNEMKDLAARARNRKLKPEEYQGGTTAVSNLGMFGIKDFAAVINPPHATILAVGAGEERAVVKKGEIKVANVMSVTLSTDHRAVDGALGAELLVGLQALHREPDGHAGLERRRHAHLLHVAAWRSSCRPSPAGWSRRSWRCGPMRREEYILVFMATVLRRWRR